MPIPVFILTALLLANFTLNAADLGAPAISIPEGNQLKLTVHAKGDQIFKCTAAIGGYEWQWQAPDATLYDKDKQTVVGSHGAGPQWIYQDGSSVKGKLIQKIDSPEQGSAPWLLLETIDSDGHGLLTGISFILRINTQGGLPPTSGCDANTTGKQVRIAYIADYSFYGH